MLGQCVLRILIRGAQARPSFGVWEVSRQINGPTYHNARADGPSHSHLACES